MEKKRLKLLYKLGILSLTIVALYGVVMRYKIAFSFPLFDQKNLLHAHSHFAFSGWISHLLYCGFVHVLSKFLEDAQLKKYWLLIGANWLTAFGMLIAFTLQGYDGFSITFSTANIFIAVIFAYCFVKDTKYLPTKHPSKNWFITALFLNVISAIGPFFLAYMMITKEIHQDYYLASVYYYLHFQYNGWFFFGALGIAFSYLPENFLGINKYYKYFALTVIPTYFLSTLWFDLPMWLYLVTLIAALLQLFAWATMLFDQRQLLSSILSESNKRWVRLIFFVAIFSITLKFILQAISVIPALSQLVFGFRPIVIAYLHLILLGAYSLFLIGWLFVQGEISNSKIAKTMTYSFLAGVALNELLLAIQGIAAFTYNSIPHINILLFCAAILLFLSALGLLCNRLFFKV